MLRQNSLGSMNSLSLSFDSNNFEDNKAETDDDSLNYDKYEKIGFLTDSKDIKESICTKHYDDNGNKYYNEYKFISYLGSGAFSKIELVEKDGVKYALKIIDKSFLKSQKNMEIDENGNIIVNTSLENALKEISILKKTNHPNIIKLYEILYCKKNKNIYLVLEYCEHGDLIYYDEETGEFKLNEHVTKKEKIEENNETYYSGRNIMGFLKDILSGLCYLHANGIIHRDIKPNNILLDKNNVCKITDFNVSSILANVDDDHIGRKICSADHFRPPEGCDLDENKELKNKNNDIKGKPIDIWALGVTAYILSYKKFPFESEKNSIFELYEKISKGKYEFPEVPKRRLILKNVISKCFELNPNKRISAENLLLHIQSCRRPNSNIINRIDEAEMWRLHRKINICNQDIYKSINFLMPNCKAIFKRFGKNANKKVNTELFKYNKYKGKIYNLYKTYNLKNLTIEEKYNVFVVDGMIFRNEDFGIPNKEEQNKEKILKKKFFEHYKKHKVKDMISRNLLKKFFKK